MKSFAKQLIQIRETKTRLNKCNGQLNNIKLNMKTMSANATLANSSNNYFLFLIFNLLL